MLSFSVCPTLCDPMDYSPPGSSVHGVLQARILEWVAMFSSTIQEYILNETQYFSPKELYMGVYGKEFIIK